MKSTIYPLYSVLNTDSYMAVHSLHELQGKYGEYSI